MLVEAGQRDAEAARRSEVDDEITRTAIHQPREATPARRRRAVVPMRRWGETRDIGETVAALASGRMAFATGSVLNLDGGLAVPKL